MFALPQKGDIFAFEVVAGIEVLLRVIASEGEQRCVVVTQYEGTPCLRLPRKATLFQVQPLTHHEWNRPLLGGWVNGSMPKELRRLGHIAVRAAEAKRVMHPQQWVNRPQKTAADADKVVPTRSWKQLLTEARAQWRWDHQRPDVLKEDALLERQSHTQLGAALAEVKKRKRLLENKGVLALRGTAFFSVWKGAVPAPLIVAAENAMQKAVLSLEGKTPKQAIRQLEALAQRLHALDEKQGHEFDSMEKEDITEALHTLAVACGIND